MSILQNFLWRFAKNIIPAKGNLQRKGISLDPLCPFFFSDTEYVQHILMDCVFARQVFFSSPLSNRIFVNIGIKAWIQYVLSYGDVFSSQLICSILYKVWNAQNLFVLQQKSYFSVFVAMEAFGCVHEFSRVNLEGDLKMPHFDNLCLGILSS